VLSKILFALSEQHSSYSAYYHVSFAETRGWWYCLTKRFWNGSKI